MNNGSCGVMKKWRKLIVTLLIVLIIFPYLKTEYLTYKHSDEFSDRRIYEGHFLELEYIKVFDYSDKTVKVHYVAKNKAYGMLVELKKNGVGNWEINSFIKEWSKTGSADDFIWPYYP